MASSDFTRNAREFTPTYQTDTYPFISPNQFDLSGRAVLITGASRGIGLATALSYARAGAAKIAIAARSAPTNLVSELQSAATSASRRKPEVLPLAIDVTDPASIDAATKEVQSRFGRLDILINNAGYLETFTPVVESDPDEWWKTWTVNLRGVYLLSRAMIPLLLDTDGGLKTLLNTSSVGALNKRPGASAYQSTKFAVLRFTEFLDAEYSEKGLLAIAMHPGGVMTELSKNMPKHTHNTILTDKVELGADTTVWITAERREWLAARYVSVNWDMKELSAEKERIVKEDLLKMRLAV
ncbi:putative oxidoreductase [Myriangium duriaei CBS 260.36]|uniref:Oxidoreductase n=1 Tax=Myriangium duriaei CBS 260.36 TaxID=1168546 RepID=A0A9P4MP31_9PEZI|nr:putative oxidoreductase [Myriangium duriaei CBS 260.36]